jgi:hypothetical protein
LAIDNPLFKGAGNGMIKIRYYGLRHFVTALRRVSLRAGSVLGEEKGVLV